MLDKEAVRAASRLEDVIPALIAGASLKRLNGSRESVTGCPFHPDDRPSLRVHRDKQTWFCDPCRTGGDVFTLVEKVRGVGFPAALGWLADRAGVTEGKQQAPRPGRRIVESYDYTDEQGALLHQTVRYEPKEFKQRRPDGAGGSIWNLQGVRLVLYRLPALVNSGTVLIVEGEKDADALWALELPATTNPLGAGKWRVEYVAQLKAAGVERVIVLPDNDEAGRAHAEAVAAACNRGGLAVQMLTLPGGPLKGDVSVYLEQHTKDDLVALLGAAPTWQSAAATTPTTQETPAAFGLTESGNAEFFAARYGRDVRYDHRRGRWLLWRQHRWQPDADAEIRRRAKAAMRQRFTDSTALEDHAARGKAAQWAHRSESRSGLQALLYLAQAESPIADGGDNWDADPMLLGVLNGVIDLRTGALRYGRREDRITMSAAVAFDPEATCPRWERFVTEIFRDADLAAFVHRGVGYSLTGDTGEQCLFMNYGTGANGKGVFTNTLAGVLGDYAYTMPFATVEQHQRSSIPNDVAALVARRFVSASETTDGARLNESRVKALTGGDLMTARFLHSEFFTFQPVAKFWLSVNHKPIVRDDSHGFWRRMRLIPFTQTFAVNPRLADELRGEAAGILAWAVRGCLAWQRHGLNPPDIVSEATREYERDSDPLADFLHEGCELGPAAEVGGRELQKHYEAWADLRGVNQRERLSATKFGTKMSERFKGERTRSGKVYRGIATRPL